MPRMVCRVVCGRFEVMATFARHLGVPFVVDVPGATARLVTGMRVRVDGNSGTVTVLGAATEEDATAVPGATLAQ